MLCRILLVLVLALPGTLSVNAAEWRVDGAERVVALSDVHGAYDAMVETLTTVGLIDASRQWVGGRAHLVIVGDLLDRGPRSRDAMDLLMRLEGEATAAGGRVHVLIGNHESMNMIGDLRYVSKDEYAAFAADETAEQRDRWFAAYARRAPQSVNAEALRERFETTFPPG
jgi:calcineurin-like phosphoesterase family protein